MTTRTRNRPKENRGSTLPPNIVAQLGKLTDRDLAHQAGVCPDTITSARTRAGIAPSQLSDRRVASDHCHIQTALSRWPHRLKGVGLDANILLNELAASTTGLTASECRQFTRSHPLGTLTRHYLTELASRTPDLRYAITDKGRAYHALLQHAGLIPPP